MKILQPKPAPIERIATVAGHSVPLVVTAWSVKRVREECSIRVDRAMVDQDEFARLFDDPTAVLATIFVVAEKRFTDLGVTVQQLLEGAGPDEIEAARVSLMRAVVDFMPRAEVRDALHRIIDEGLRETEQTIASAVSGLIDEHDAALATPAPAPDTTSEAPPAA